MTNQSERVQSIFELQTQHKWVNKKTTAEQRIAKLEKLKQVIQRREDDVVTALHNDLRRDEEGARGEARSIYGEIDMISAQLAGWMEPVSADPAPFTDASARIVTEARGIVLLFSPWNYPFALAFQPLASIIAAGNCCIVKPNEVAPHVSTLVAEILNEVFDERDVAVFEGGIDLANELLELPTDHIFFTGSPAIGKIIMAAAAKNLTSVTLELGGKNPVIVDRTADLATSAGTIASFRNMNNGQVCLCPENIWVPEELADQFIEAVKGSFDAMFYVDGKLNAETTGKIIDDRNFARVMGYIDDAKAKGANIAYGGKGDSELRSIHPTIMTDVPADANIMSEETFGPILNIFTYKEVDEAISAIQKDSKPLALYIFTQNDEFVETVLSQTSSGGVTVNGCLLHVACADLPFGGVNGSGIGAYHGKYGYLELSHQRSVLMM